MKHSWLMSLSVLLLAVQAPPAMAAPAERCWHENAAIEQDIGYCQVVRVGRTLHVSGVAAEGPMPAAVDEVYGRLAAILKARGAGLGQVVKETVFTTDLDAFIAQRAARRKHYGDQLPAASWVQVQRLYLPSFVLEVELEVDLGP